MADTAKSGAASKKSRNKNEQDKTKGGDVANRKNKKFVNLYSEEGKERQTILLNGRHPCNCLASRHQLVNNCVSCGRIVCTQEGSGACFTCGEMVASPREMEMLTKNSRKAAQLRQKIEEQDNALAAAIAHKNRLLDFDRSCAKRTQVIDDDRDYFSSNNKWLTQKERKALKEIEERRDKAKSVRGTQLRMDLDIAGRKVVVKNEEVPELYLPETERIIDETVDELPSYISNRELTEIEFVETDVALKASTERMTDHLQMLRLQDNHIAEISDEGVCLSMHQPYASLVLAGIKKHEGRQWLHGHRGRLWIHAAAKQVTPVQIEKVLNSYRMINEEAVSRAPKQYPTGSLLGCVDVVDCLPQTQYRERFPLGEISDSYVFICENPRRLKVPIPMRGGAKIFKLEPRLHNAARKQVLFTVDEIE